MARKPKTRPNPDAAAAVPVSELATSNETSTPARRGRKPKAAALSSALPLAAGIGGPATADTPKAGPAEVPGRRGPGRKPKQAAGAGIASSVQDDGAASQGQTSPQPEAEAIPDLIEDDAPAVAAASQAGAAADSAPAQPDLDPSRSADETAQPLPEAGASNPAKPAAHWDCTTDRVQFDWPAIEPAATRDGPNRGMAKLLVAARAEGAQSRWPF